jgi:hypothetical protein
MVDVFALIAVWTSAFLTLMVLSFLFKENPFYRLAEYLFVGLSSGYTFAATLRVFVNQALDPIFAGQFDFIVPLILGCLFYAQFTKKYSILYRVPLSLAIGYGLGITIWSVFDTYFIVQVKATMLPLYGSDIITTIDNLVIVVGTILSISYFILHREQKGVYGKFTKAGKYFVLATLGAVFGTTVLGRMALIIQRIQFLVGDPAFPWLALKVGTAQEGQYVPVALVAFLMIFGAYLYRERKTKPESGNKPKP